MRLVSSLALRMLAKIRFKSASSDSNKPENNERDKNPFLQSHSNLAFAHP